MRKKGEMMRHGQKPAVDISNYKARTLQHSLFSVSDVDIGVSVSS